MRTLLVAVLLLAATPAEAQAGCGWYALAGAFQDFRAAQRRASLVGGAIFDADRSDAPTAGQGWFVVGFGPTNRRLADAVRGNYQAQGVGDAYVAQRCFF